VNLVTLIFGERPSQRRIRITAPPRNVKWRTVRPKQDQTPVNAWRAEADHRVNTAHGSLEARGGKDFVVAHTPHDHAVVKGDIFERTYEPAGEGLYRKRTDVVLRYFTLDRPAIVETLEGDQRAEPGDWIMQGVSGELWPVPREKALEKYEQA
jgi:hypothetical protein